jgi:hypothetical protein
MDYLKNVVTKYPDHAFGHYFLSKCYRATGKENLAEEHLGRFLNICERDNWWSNMAEKYGVHFHAGHSHIGTPGPERTLQTALN